MRKLRWWYCNWLDRGEFHLHFGGFPHWFGLVLNGDWPFVHWFGRDTR